MHQLHLWIVLLSITIFIPPLQAVEINNELPESLSQWYKPHNKRQVWLHTMFGMRRELQAVEEYVDQKDLKGINKWSERLISHYRRLPEMVPEWEELVDVEVIEALEQAVKKRDFSDIRFNIRRLQKKCRSCHTKYRVLASMRYRSADFSTQTIGNGEKDYKYTRFMKMISRSLNRVRIAAEDDHWSVASEASKQFQQELDMLGKSCKSCHKDNEPYERILGSSTLKSIQQMDVGIGEKNIKAVKINLGETAVKVCARCHGVHRSLSDIRTQLFEK